LYPAIASALVLILRFVPSAKDRQQLNAILMRIFTPYLHNRLLIKPAGVGLHPQPSVCHSHYGLQPQQGMWPTGPNNPNSSIEALADALRYKLYLVWLSGVESTVQR
jgi:hypothetical protein